jgi:hypothetical protein
MDAISEFPLQICAADASSLWQGDHWADNIRLWHKADPTEPPKNVRFRTCARPLSQKQRSPPAFRWLDLSDCAVSPPKLPLKLLRRMARA